MPANSIEKLLASEIKQKQSMRKYGNTSLGTYKILKHYIFVSLNPKILKFSDGQPYMQPFICSSCSEKARQPSVRISVV